MSSRNGLDFVFHFPSKDTEYEPIQCSKICSQAEVYFDILEIIFFFLAGLLKNQFADFKRNGQTLNKSAQSALSIPMLQERENKVPDRAHFSRAGEA